MMKTTMGAKPQAKCEVLPRLSVLSDDAGNLTFPGTDDQTSAFLSALLADDIRAALHAPMPGSANPREEAASRAAVVVARLVDKGAIRFSSAVTPNWRADFPRIRKLLS